MSSKFLSQTLVFVAISVLTLSCKNDDKTKLKVGFSQCVGNDAWRRQMLSEMHLQMIFNQEIELIYTDANNISKTQVSQIDSLQKLGIDLLIVSPNEAEPLTAIVDQVYDSGIPVILIDRKTNSDKYNTFIGADNEEVGYLAGLFAANRVKDGVRVLEILGLQGSSPSQERNHGFESAMQTFGNEKSHLKIHGNWLGDTAYARLKRAGFVADSFDLVFAHNDVMARAANQYFDEIGSPNIPIVGIDGLVGEDLGLELVESGEISATVLYPTGGREAIESAAKILAGEEVPRRIHLNSTLVDKSNATVLLNLAQVTKEQRDLTDQLNDRVEKQIAFSRNRENLLYILGTLLLMLVGLLVYVFRINRVSLAQQKRIAEQNVELEQVIKTKDKFFSVIAHDLKSPLSSLKSFSDLLLRNYKKLDETVLLQKFERLNLSVVNTIKLTENLISWAQLEMDKQLTHHSEFELNEIIKSTLELAKPIADEKGIELSCNCNSIYKVSADVNQIEFIIRNLVMNAVKYTKSGGSVSVKVQTLEHQKMSISVQDTGVGIDPKILKKLGTLEKITSVLGTSGEMGTGLGLLLSHEFAKRNQATLVFDSELGVGTKITLTLNLVN